MKSRALKSWDYHELPNYHELPKCNHKGPREGEEGDQRQKAVRPWKWEETRRGVRGAMGPGTPGGSAAHFLTRVPCSKRMNVCHLEPLWPDTLLLQPQETSSILLNVPQTKPLGKMGLTEIRKDLSFSASACASWPRPVLALEGTP